MSIDISRHMDILNPMQNPKKICIIGAGATGSYVTYSIAKMGYKDIHVFDFDEVESHNIANQMYSLDNVGDTKVSALFDMIERFTETQLHAWRQRVDKEFMDQHSSLFESFDVVFLLVDTLSARAEIYDWYEDNAIPTFFIETRLTATSGDIYCFHSFSPSGDKWRESLPTDEDVPRDLTACGSPITIGHSAMALAAHAAWKFMDWARGQDVPYHVWHEFRSDHCKVEDTA